MSYAFFMRILSACVNFMRICSFQQGNKYDDYLPNNKFHLHVLLDGRTKTFGVALFKQSKALDVEVCDYRFVEMVPGDILENVIDIVFTELKF